ncbi:hypothetical protein [Methanolobus vulcani]|nr:hypothetical protein [Methanolobus vulcani]
MDVNIPLIVVGAGHHKHAFDACKYIPECMKESVSIWKYVVGESEEW